MALNGPLRLPEAAFSEAVVSVVKVGLATPNGDEGLGLSTAFFPFRLHGVDIH